MTVSMKLQWKDDVLDVVLVSRVMSKKRIDLAFNVYALL